MPGNIAGCDFCGTVEVAGDAATHSPGTRVCGAIFPYKPDEPRSGSFAEFLVADSRLLLRVPGTWDDLQGAALGGIGWSTVCQAISHPDALAPEGLPSSPSEGRSTPVLVYGGSTATGTMACQLLKLSGYTPLAVTSPQSSALATQYGAAYTASYLLVDCVGSIRAIAAGKMIRHALDCITDAQSAATCFASLGRAGGSYACLEECPQAWLTRRTVCVKEVMGYEILGQRVYLGPTTTYTREPSQLSFGIGLEWAAEMQELVDKELVRPHPALEVGGRWDGIIKGLDMLVRGEVKGHKIVVRISTP
ncbi:putative zinc binding [Diaporthe ampelina]|uniref:Putative zinc binding n=1 Tax=Diaporthe ampelina TaxID=1214573 RepID=A0A0G2G0T7_9PEZI|nr:putative zinc binding [Diaporthe ampelina]